MCSCIRPAKQNRNQQTRVYSYQTSVAVIKAKLSGYVPVCMILNGRHIRKLDRGAVMVKLQLQTWGFLYV